MSILTSRKFWLQVLAAVIALVAGKVGEALGLDQDTVKTIVTYLLGLAGLGMFAHAATDAVSLLSGVQKRK